MDEKVKSSLFSKSVGQFKANWKKLSIAFLVFTLLSAAGSFGGSSSDRVDPGTLVVFVATVVVLIGLRLIVEGAAVSYFLKAARGEDLSISDSLGFAFKRWKDLLAQGLLLAGIGLAGTLVVGGLVLATLIYLTKGNLPAIEQFGLPQISVLAYLGLCLLPIIIYFAVRLSFAILALVDSDLSGRVSIARSWALTRGKVLYVIGCYLPFIGWGLLALMCTMALILLSVAFWPLFFVSIPAYIVVVFIIGVVGQLMLSNVYVSLKDMADGK